MATEAHKTEEVTPATPAAAITPVAPKGPRSYLVMMLLAVLLTPTGLARAYRGEQIGWTRFWIYVGATVAMIIPFLNILAALAMLALAVWGIVDVFQLRKLKTDAEGGTLLTSERDEKYAKAFYIYFLVVLILTGVGILLAIVFGAFLVNLLMNNSNAPGRYDYSDSYDSSRFLREFEQAR